MDGCSAAASACIHCGAASASSLARSFPRLKLCIPVVRRAACLVPIGRIISNCQDTTATSIPYGATYSRWSSALRHHQHRDGAPHQIYHNVGIYMDLSLRKRGDIRCYLSTQFRIYPSLTFNRTSLRRARTMSARTISYYITTRCYNYFTAILNSLSQQSANRPRRIILFDRAELILGNVSRKHDVYVSIEERMHFALDARQRERRTRSG